MTVLPPFVREWSTVPGTEHLPTPTLIIDAAALRRNLTDMDNHCRTAQVSLRPHAKTHKSTWIARQQVACGAVGIAVATLAEAKVLAEAGIGGILLTTPIAGDTKHNQLRALLTAGADITVVAETVGGVEELGAIATSAGLAIKVLVDIDVGNGRTGAATPGAAADVASAIAGHDSLALAGLQAYAGQVQHILSLEARATAQRQVRERTAAARDAICTRGLEVAIVSGGGTGSYYNDTRCGPFTEVQPGSYAVMDEEYATLEKMPGELFFENAVYVLATVVADAGRDWVTVDAGSKALSESYVPPLPIGPKAAYTYRSMGDELGAVATLMGERAVRGDRILIRPAHCDPTINLYRTFLAVDITERSAREIAVDLR